MNKTAEEIQKENEDMQEFLSKFKASCPVYSFTVGAPTNMAATVAGMYLICLDVDTIKTTIDKVALADAIDNHSILFFERHHISELCSILDGALQIIKNNKGIDEGDIRDFVYELAKYISLPKQYSELLGFMGGHISDLMKQHPNTPPEIFRRLKAIFNKIWFVPYNDIDAIAKQAAGAAAKGGNPNE